jgi:23S rRNA (cytosine1962-C5)-methyltransferase
MSLQVLRLKNHEERRLLGGHLWIYSNEIDTKKTPLKQFTPGEQVHIETSRGKLIGTAYVNPQSLICARLFSRRRESLNYQLLVERMQHALALRELLFKQPYYRLIYGESDLLPGLVVDRFGDHLSVQINSWGMQNVQTEIIDALKTVLQPTSIILKNDSSTRSLEGLETIVEVVEGDSPEEVELIENGVKFIAPLFTGQKTGWFYDQRYNRAELKKYAPGKRVLDLFSYVGSFGVQAATFGAKEVWLVDGSRSALAAAEKNSILNGVENKVTIALGDAFDILKSLRDDGEMFDIIVVDPPAFIKRKKYHKNGLQAYHRINDLAMRLLADDGLILSASCSMHLKREELMNVLRVSGQHQNRLIQVLFEGMQGPDHPVHPAISETRYLKAFLARALKMA